MVRRMVLMGVASRGFSLEETGNIHVSIHTRSFLFVSFGLVLVSVFRSHSDLANHHVYIIRWWKGVH